MALAVCGAATISFSAILVRAANVSPSTAAIFRCAYALPVLGLLAYLERSHTRDQHVRRRPWLAAAAGIFLATDLISWHHAIADVGAGLATVLGNAQVAVVPFAAWCLYRERLSRRVLVMLPVAILGVVLVSGVIGGHAYGSHPATGAAFGAVTALTYTIFLLLLRAGSGPAATIEPLLIATAIGTVAATLIGAIVGDAQFVPTWPAHAWLALLALTSQVLGWVLITYALPRLPAATTSIILTVQPVGSLIFAALIFGEDPGVVQLVGAALILVTLTTMSLRSRSPASAAPRRASRGHSAARHRARGR